MNECRTFVFPAGGALVAAAIVMLVGRLSFGEFTRWGELECQIIGILATVAALAGAMTGTKLMQRHGRHSH